MHLLLVFLMFLDTHTVLEILLVAFLALGFAGMEAILPFWALSF